MRSARTNETRGAVDARDVNGAAGLVNGDHRPLHACVESALEAYLESLDSTRVTGLYDLVMSEVERPLLVAVMRFAQGNQTRAAKALGLNRGTLRCKLSEHGLLENR